MKEVIIIGAGASGMAAAVAASRSGNRVTLVERQSRVGRKLLSTGNGRCNLTNTGAAIESYHGEDPSFARAALEKHPPEDILRFFSGLGLLTVTEHGGRVYPLSSHAASVLDVLRLALVREGVAVITGARAGEVTKKGGRFLVRWPDGGAEADRLIVACGGCAGSRLGGVMDGYGILGGFGHSRTALYPALTQIRTDPDYPRALKGVRADAALRVLSRGRVIAENAGEVLFFENGVSGTAVFEISRAVSAASGQSLTVSLDFFRGYTRDEVEGYIFSRREAAPDEAANTILTGSVHNRLGQMLCKYASIGADRTAGQLTDSDIARLAAACGDFRLNVTGVSGFETAQVTAGGARTSEFCPETLESRLVPGLYACGEVLDVDGDCGGCNLQWAWASGLTAGESV